MRTFLVFGAIVLLAVVPRQHGCCAELAVQQSSAIPSGRTVRESVLAPPRSDGIVKVRAAFQLLDLDEIDEEKETFEFTGVLTLKWMDQRQAFDPAKAGTDTKVYQGAYQCNELSPAWFPQVVLANASDLDARSAMVLLVESDGNSTLIQKINAIRQ